MLCYAHVITKIGFVRRFFTNLTLAAARGTPILPRPISSFRQFPRRDFTHSCRTQIHIALPGLLRFGTHSFKIRHFVLKRSRSFVLERSRSFVLAAAVAGSAHVLLRKKPPTRQNVRFLHHNRVPPSALSIRCSRHTPCAVHLSLTANFNGRARTTIRDWPAAPKFTHMLGAGLQTPPSARP